MKKALALVLSLLVAFSMLGIVAAAETEEPKYKEVTVNFIIDGIVAKEITVAAGQAIYPEYVPEVETEFFTTGENGEKIKHTFKGWLSSFDGKLHHAGTMPAPDGSVQEINYTAEYMLEDYSERQSFWNFIESIFERINLLFEYFATIFNF